MLLVDGRGDHQFAAQVADDAARQYVGAARRVMIADDEHAAADPKYRHLLRLDQGAHAGVGVDIVERADLAPARRHARASRCFFNSPANAGRGWPRSSTNTT